MAPESNLGLCSKKLETKNFNSCMTYQKLQNPCLVTGDGLLYLDFSFSSEGNEALKIPRKNVALVENLTSSI